MRIFGRILTRLKAAVGITQWPLFNVGGTAGSGWFPVIRESFAGAWQRGITVNRQEVLSYSTVWACVTLIAADIAKLWIKLTIKDVDGICTETENSAYSPVLKKPNHFQTRVKFFEYWIISKLTTGNTYVLKERDNRGGEGRGNVTALYVLDPSRVQVLVAPNGDVFYALSADNLAGITEASVVVPARDIIHDIAVPLFHPLVGVSPIFACGLAATQGLNILKNYSKLFASGAQLSGVLTAPGPISNETAERLEKHWAETYTGEANIGKVAALGDGLHFEPMTMTAVDAEVVKQLQMSDERICATFHVPGFMVGIGPAPPYTDIQSINLQYYTQALQNPIENLEVLLVEGLELQPKYGIEFDLNALLRMDSKTLTAVLKEQVQGGFLKPNEARAELDRKPVAGGDTCYLQQQMYSLDALNKRDTAAPAPATPAMDPAREPGTKGIEGVPEPDLMPLLEEFDRRLAA